MNKDYQIEEFKISPTTYIVLTMSYLRYSDYLAEIGEILKQKKFKGTVYFDLLLNNGLNDRFFSMDFNMEGFILSTFNKIDPPSANLLKFSGTFYSKRMPLINNSIFSDAKKYMIKKEISKYSGNKIPIA